MCYRVVMGINWKNVSIVLGKMFRFICTNAGVVENEEMTLPISNFTLGKKCCKSCRNSRAKQSYNKEEYKEKYDPLIRQTKYRKQKKGEWLLKRTPLRNKLLSKCLDEDLTIENFNSLFVKKEDYDNIVNNPDYEFAYSKMFKTDFITRRFR